ncbi:peptidoglycan editing factor PgeF [Desulforegula conservatrix]|uniref:peptidoglycan editing factor PgeF n=1 Tax=Desulforegula conservatrix TaxID=153026 RepID=UPI000409D075|nr:peptidoglycan editing factor PgeF [Desulforegula conservatrix]
MKNSSFIRKDIFGVPVLKSEILESFKDLSHGFSTRRGGESPAPYDSLNIGIAVGDLEENVKKNRNLISGISCSERSVYLTQVHGSEILVIKNDSSIPDPDTVKADGVITDCKDLALVIQTADCQAALLYDPVKKVAGAVHSGWRGNVFDILGRTVRKMAEVFDSDPSDIRASIGPSLGPCCAEFINFRTELPEALWAYGDEKCFFDFWEISRAQLQKAGLQADRISVSGLCTKCDKDSFFSYRGSKITGRMAGFICINN